MTENKHLNILEIDSGEKWSENLNLFNYSLYLKPELLESIRDSDKTPIYLDFKYGDEIIGKLSGLIVKNRSLRSSYLYFYSGPALSTYSKDDVLVIMRELLGYATKKRYYRIIIASYYQQYTDEIVCDGYFSTKRIEFEVDLDNHNEQLYSRRFKNNLKKSRKTDAVVAFPDLKARANDFFKLLEGTRKERTQKSRKNYNPMFLPHIDKEKLLKASNTNAFSYTTIYFQDELSVMALNFFNKKHLNLFMYGMDASGYQNGFASLLFDQVIKQLKEGGYHSLNLGGVPENEDGENLSIFKKSMGAVEKTVYGATTNFLTYPYKLFNPILNLGRKLPQDNIMVKWIKRIF